MKRKHMIINHRNAALLALALGTGSALAVDGTWIDAAGSWGDASKWTGGVAAGVGATANFQNTVGGSRNVTLDGDRTVGILNLGFSTNNRGLTLQSGTPVLPDLISELILDNGGSDAQINFKNGGGNVAINVAVELRSNLLITNSDTGGNKGFWFGAGLSSTNGNLTITNTSNANSRTKFNSVISDGASGNSITFNQTGGWSEFTAANTFTGTTTNGGGLLHLGNTAGISLALQNSALNTTGSIAGTATAGLRLYAGITSLTVGGLIGNKDMNATGTGVFSTSTSNYNLVTALTLNPGTGKSYAYDGAIEDGAVGMTLTKTGDGTQTLGGTNTYTGDTLVSAGTLFVNGSLSSSTNDVTVGSAATIGGSGSIAGALYFAPDSFFDVFLSDPLAVAGTISFGSGFGINNLTGIDWDTVVLGSYTILDSSTDFSAAGLDNWGSANAVTVGTLGRTAHFESGSLKLVVAIPEPSAALLGGLGFLGLLRRRRN